MVSSQSCGWHRRSCLIRAFYWKWLPAAPDLISSDLICPLSLPRPQGSGLPREFGSRTGCCLYSSVPADHLGLPPVFYLRLFSKQAFPAHPHYPPASISLLPICEVCVRHWRRQEFPGGPRACRLHHLQPPLGSEHTSPPCTRGLMQPLHHRRHPASPPHPPPSAFLFSSPQDRAPN